MRVKVCPKCGTQNLSSALKCNSCGEYLSVENLMDTESGQFLSKTEENEKDKLVKTAVKVNKGRDIAIGFFGWAVFHNLYFLIALFMNMRSSYNLFGSNAASIVFLILPFVIGLLVVILTKRAWIGVGSVLAIFTSTFIYLSYGLSLFGFLLPFPVGLGLLMQ